MILLLSRSCSSFRCCICFHLVLPISVQMCVLTMSLRFFFLWFSTVSFLFPKFHFSPLLFFKNTCFFPTVPPLKDSHFLSSSSASPFSSSPHFLAVSVFSLIPLFWCFFTFSSCLTLVHFFTIVLPFSGFLHVSTSFSVLPFQPRPSYPPLHLAALLPLCSLFSTVFFLPLFYLLWSTELAQA